MRVFHSTLALHLECINYKMHRHSSFRAQPCVFTYILCMFRSFKVSVREFDTHIYITHHITSNKICDCIIIRGKKKYCRWRLFLNSVNLCSSCRYNEAHRQDSVWIVVGSQRACRLLQIRFIFALALRLQIENCPLLLHRLRCLCIIIILRYYAPTLPRLREVVFFSMFNVCLCLMFVVPFSVSLLCCAWESDWFLVIEWSVQLTTRVRIECVRKQFECWIVRVE